MAPDDDPLEVALTLPRDAAAPAIARAYVSEHATWLAPPLLDDVRLLVSELVGNAVRYGQEEITLRLRPDPPGIEVSVTDHGSEMPVLPDGLPDPSVPSGRGLSIVDLLASAWGVERLGTGKTVWFDLRPER